MGTGEMRADRKGLWIEDPDAGLRFRLGEVGSELAMTLAEQGNMSAARQAMAKPHFGLWFSRVF